MDSVKAITDTYSTIKDIYREWAEEVTIYLEDKVGEDTPHIRTLWKDLLCLSLLEDPWEIASEEAGPIKDSL